MKDAMKPRIRLKHFNDLDEALSYVTGELTVTLEDDLGRMEGEDRRHYSADDRREMKSRIADIRAVTPLVEAAPKLYEALRYIANQSIGDDWTAEQAIQFAKQLAKEALAMAEPAKG